MSSSFVDWIRAAYKLNGWEAALRPGSNKINLCYVEGVDPKTGTPNKNRPDAFDSTRNVFRIMDDGSLKMELSVTATTHAGRYYEQIHLLNPGGAFHIGIGPQSAWQMGIYHHGNYPALLNTRPLHGTRDVHRDFTRNGPAVFETVGAHHHWGYNFSRESVQTAAAGCQVGEFENEHMQMIALCRGDAEFLSNHAMWWTSTVMTAAQLMAAKAYCDKPPIIVTADKPGWFAGWSK